LPRQPRIDIPGYYHIIDRGVERREVFLDSLDYEYFLELLCNMLDGYNIILHNYSLMPNHYHLLIQTFSNNLSKFMRQLNMHYAIYFNKKYKRVGHLWQGRFKSQLVSDEAYLYTLILYIEKNPLKAKIVKKLEDYRYSSYHHFLKKDIPHCLQNSWIVKQYRGDIEAIKAFFESEIDTTQLSEMKKASSLIEAPNITIETDMEELKKMFEDIKSIEDRNEIILKAYKSGYSQHMIAKYLGLSQPAINKIIKKRVGK